MRSACPLLCRAGWPQVQARWAPPFFGRGLGLVEHGLEGLARQLPAAGQGHEFGLGQHLAVGRRLTGLAQLAHQGEGLLDDQGFDGVCQTEVAWLHEGPRRGVAMRVPNSCSDYPTRPRNPRNNYCTRGDVGPVGDPGRK